MAVSVKRQLICGCPNVSMMVRDRPLARFLPISPLCLANTRRPQRNSALSSRRRESLLVSSFAVARSDGSTDSPERPRSCQLSSRGIDAEETDGRPLSRLRELTNARPSGARSRRLRGRLPTSSCWTVRLNHPTPPARWQERRSGKPPRKVGPESLVDRVRAFRVRQSQCVRDLDRRFLEPEFGVAPGRLFLPSDQYLRAPQSRGSRVVAAWP